MIKKGQVTLFIIIGMVILILTGLYLVFMTNVREEPDREGVDFESIRIYIESGLDTYSWEAFEELGKKGGYTNISKRNNKNTLKYENRNISIGIEGHTMAVLPNFIKEIGYEKLNNMALIPPNYPWNEFYIENNHNGDLFNHSIGRVHLPRLEGGGDGPSIKEQIESYIEMMIPSLNIEAPFRHEYDFNIGEPNAEVEFSGMHTTVSLNYPINVTHRGTNTRKKMEDFKAELALPFGIFYQRVVEQALYDELHKLDFNIENINIDYTGGLDVGVNVYSKEAELPYNGSVDIIEFVYNYAPGGSPYIFRLGRENRAPVMKELEAKPGYEIDGIDLENIDSTYQSNITDYIYEPEAIDPDFPDGFAGSQYDNLIFTYHTEHINDSYDGFVDCDNTFNIIDESTGKFEIDCNGISGQKECNVGVYVRDFEERQRFQTITIESNEFIVPNIDYRTANFKYECSE